MTTLPTYDLTPAPRALARQERRIIRSRANALAALAALLGLLKIVAISIEPAAAPLESSLAEHTARKDAAEASIATMTETLAQVTADTGLISDIGKQPDWGSFLRLLAGTTEDLAALQNVNIALLSQPPADKPAAQATRPLAPADATPAATGRGPFALQITGQVQEPGHAAQLSLRLENLRIFQQVSVRETTRREPGTPAVFTIDCRFGQPSGSNPAGSNQQAPTTTKEASP